MTEQEEFEFRRRFELEQQAQKPNPTLEQKLLSSVPGRLLQGARDPIDAAAQLLPRGLEFVSSVGGLAPNPVSEFFGSEAQRVDKGISEAEAKYNEARRATGQDGFDAARLVGNIASPANLAISARIPMLSKTIAGRFGGGVATGMAGGALQPVDMSGGDNFAATKIGQTVIGGVTGGVATPILGKMGDFVARKLAETSNSPTLVRLQDVAKEFAESSGLNWFALRPNEQTELVSAAQKAAEQYKGIDPKVAGRIKDFESLGMPYTLGQVTREPMQFATEKNLTQVPGVGDPLRERFMAQNAMLQKTIGGLAQGANEQQFAGNALVNSLRNYDNTLAKQVGDAYKLARESVGKDAEVPLQGLAQDFAQVLNDFGDKVPSGVRNNFADYGLDPTNAKMTQRKLFTVEEADKLLKVINANQSSDPATNTALKMLRDSVKRSVLQDAGVDDVFATARKMAAQRFSLQDAIPALDAAASGSANPDTFVQNFILSQTASTPKVKELAKLLRENDPQAFQEAKTQMAAYLQRQAFGENLAGDKSLSAERFAKALRELGTEKIEAFFTKPEVDLLRRTARIGSYMESVPYASRPNTSGNFGAITNIAARIPGMPVTSAIVGALKNSVGNQLAVSKALSGKPEANLTPEQVRYLSQLLTVGGLSSGASTAQSLK